MIQTRSPTGGSKYHYQYFYLIQQICKQKQVENMKYKIVENKVIEIWNAKPNICNVAMLNIFPMCLF